MQFYAVLSAAILLGVAGQIFMKSGACGPSDEAVTKFLFLTLRKITRDWKMPQRTWEEAANLFAIVLGD